MMRKVWICSISVGSCLVLAAVWGMLAVPGSALADKPPHSHGIQSDDEGEFKDIPVCITLDPGSRVGADDEVPDEYCDSKKNKIRAFVGRNRIIVLEVGEKSGRTLFLDLFQAKTCDCSTQIDVEPIDNACDDPTPCLIDVPFVANFISDVRFNISGGEDLDDLPFGCTHEDNARLTFTDGVDTWVLQWGPYDSAGGPGLCPGSGHITVTRTDDNTWDFTTTGNHLACLYRQENPPHAATEYHGQFFVPFSGMAVAVKNQTAPVVASCPAQEDRDRRGRELSPSCDLIGSCP